MKKYGGQRQNEGLAHKIVFIKRLKMLLKTIRWIRSKPKPGRPTKYNEATVDSVNAYMLCCKAENIFPTKGVKPELDVDDDTIVEWAKTKPRKFADNKKKR